MKFEVDAKELGTLVGELASIARPDPKADVKTGIALELEGTVLKLRICDLQGFYYSERTINVTPYKEGDVVLDLLHFNNIMSVQRGTAEIDVEPNDNGTLIQDRTNLTVLGLPYSVPKLDPPTDGWHYNDEIDSLSTAISKANRNRDPNDDPRFAIGSIAFKIS